MSNSGWAAAETQAGAGLERKTCSVDNGRGRQAGRQGAEWQGRQDVLPVLPGVAGQRRRPGHGGRRQCRQV